MLGSPRLYKSFAKRLGVFVFALGLLPSAAYAVTAQESELPPAQEARYRAMINELRCLVCMNQTIADSNAELAQDLRGQVHDRIEAGESDDQIRDYVTQRYGDFVLYKPPLNAVTFVLWLGPFLLVLITAVLVFFRLRRKPIKGGDIATKQVNADQARLKKILEDENS